MMEKFIDIKQLSERLSVKVKTIYGWVRDGRIPCYKLEGLLRFNVSEIEEWAEKRRRDVGSIKKHERIARDILTRR